MYDSLFEYFCIKSKSTQSSVGKYCIPFIKKGGNFISYKSISSDEELLSSKNAQNKLCCKLTNNISFELPDTNIQRNFLIFEKFDNTAMKYPRNNGIPKKKPL